MRVGLDSDEVIVADIVLAWQRTVGAGTARVNPKGGAIALGHPLGATGCFLTTTAVHELQASDTLIARG